MRNWAINALYKRRKVQISDKAALQLQNMAEQEYISSSDLIERLTARHSQELAKRLELKVFFQPYRKDLGGFKFDSIERC